MPRRARASAGRSLVRQRAARTLAALAVVAVVACSDAGQSGARTGARLRAEKRTTDSTWAVDLAIAALRDSANPIALRVESFTKGSNGFQVRLLPATGTANTGGGLVWVSEEGEVTVVGRYK